MNEYYKYLVGLFIGGIESTPSPSMFSFKMEDSIYSPFPELELFIRDFTGSLLENGSFTSGIDLNVKLGVGSENKFLNGEFRSVLRDTVGLETTNGMLGGRLKVRAIHKSFFQNRDAVNEAFKKMSVSDVVKKLFPDEKDIDIEETSGNIETYCFTDRYEFINDVLLPLSTNGKPSPYVFFRDLSGTLHFKSLGTLENGSLEKKLKFGVASDDSGSLDDTIKIFLPFNEMLDRTVKSFSVSGKFLNSELEIKSNTYSIKDCVKNTIPVLLQKEFVNNKYFGREFNPALDYDKLNTAQGGDGLRSGIFTDKALCSLPLHIDLVSGKVVEVEVSMLDRERKVIPSEMFSGKYLIERSTHFWDGNEKDAHTELVLARSSVKPPRDSLLISGAFGG